MLTNNVKLVIWDLDDTFWRGTLSEGPITVPRENVEIVTTLSRRGIISSICSKNNYDDARQVLEECGAWPFFVFPRIARAKSRFLLSANIRGSTGAEQRRRMAYNATVAAYCKQRGTFDFVPIDDIVPKSEIINAQHFTRKGYFALASELMRRMDGGASVPLPTVMSSFSTAGLRDVANAGLPLVLANGRLRVPPWQWLSAMWRGGKEIRLRMDFGPVRTLAARPIAVARRMNSRTRQIRRAFGPGAVVD